MCYCDLEMPDFYRAKSVKATKDHRCCSCLRTIRKNEKYRYISGKWDGDFDTYKKCHECAQKDNLMHLLEDCRCYTITDTFEEWEDAYENNQQLTKAFDLNITSLLMKAT